MKKYICFLFISISSSITLMAQDNLIGNTGYVGIGTITPSAKLEVVTAVTSLRLDGGAPVYGYDINVIAGGGWARDYSFSSNGVERAHIGALGNGDNLRFIYFDTNGTSATGYESPEMVITKSGNVGIGTIAPSSKLYVNENTPNGVITKHGLVVNRATTISSNSTSYDKAIVGNVTKYSIPSGVTDSGYKIGVDASSYAANSNFAGTLKSNYGVWARAGIHIAAPTAVVQNAFAVKAEILDNATGTTIQNAYGVHISTNNYNKATVNNRYDLYASTASAKNYFAGNVGIGTSTPNAKLEVNYGGGTSTSIGAKIIGGGSVAENITLSLQDTGTTANNVNILEFKNAGGRSAIIKAVNPIIYGWTGSNLVLEAASNHQGSTNSNQLSLNRYGNVGIGTSGAQDVKLTVDGDIINTAGSGGTLTLLDDDISRNNRIVLGADDDGAYIKSAWVGSGGTQAISFRNAYDDHVMTIADNGNVGIGTTTTGGHKLAVDGSIGAREVKVETTVWSDFVFEEDYSLPTLKEVAQHIQEKGHLKDIPSAKEVAKNGIFLGEMDAKLLQKIEELTLYTLAQEKKIQNLEAQNEMLLKLQARIEQLEAAKK